MRFREFTRIVTPPIVGIIAGKLRRNLQTSEQPSVKDERPRPCLELSHVRAFEAKIPELREFGFQASNSNAADLLDFYNAYVPLIRPQSVGAAKRTLLARLAMAAPELSEKAKDAIAIADLEDGLPDRARRLQTHPDYASSLSDQIQAAEAAYGAAYLSEDWGSPSRGASILFYLQNNEKMFSGKRVMHIAPEAETRQWLKENCQYTVVDGAPDDQTDLAADMLDIPAPSGSFDIIICHRVLEHVLDDISAMKEIFRLLSSGGIFNMSVPQAPHRIMTAEWMVQDGSHHDHVRHYGADLADRLTSVGFQVSIEDWLLKQSREDLLSRAAYPMRMYNARKP